MRWAIYLLANERSEIPSEPHAISNGSLESAEEWAGKLLSSDEDGHTCWHVECIDELDVIDMFND